MRRSPSPDVRQTLLGRSQTAQSVRWGSLVSLSALIWATQGWAQTTISSNQSTPVATATANNGQPADVNITSSGGITLSSGTAVTLNSNNSVTNAGTIKIQDSNGATGILVQGGNTGQVNTTGSIVINESTTPPSPPGGGDGPFAVGSGRYGIRVVGTSPFTGSITQGTGGSISVQGNTSAGVSVETNLTGSIENDAPINVTGNNSFGLHTLGTVSGNITLTGGVTATGQASEGVTIGNDVAGKFELENTISATGFKSTTRVTDAASLAAMNANDKLIGGPALDIQGNIAGGVSIDDSTGAAATAGAVISSGSAPAIQIGAVGRDITLGDFGTGADGRGLLIKGTVTAEGVQNGVATTAVQLGVAGGGAVNTTDGIHLTGTVSSISFQANATGLLLNAGAKVPFIEHDGTTAAIATSDAASQATAILIQPGAVVSGLANTVTISSNLTGAIGNSTAIADKSGTLSFIHNLGAIAATVSPVAGSGVVAGGQATALDLSANTTGVTLLQEPLNATATAPSITGAILLGSGSDNLTFLAGTENGDISFGAGANSLTINNGASVTGAMTATNGTLAINVGTGSLTINNAAHLNLTSLNLGAASQTILTADPVAGGATELDVHGAAVIATGAKLGLRFNSLVQGTQTFTLIRADQLQAGTIDQSLLGLFPFIYSATLTTNQAAGTISASIVQKTAAQIGIPTATQGAFQPLLTAANTDSDLRNAILAQTDHGGLIAAYNQLLPNHSGGVFETYAAGSDALARAIDDRQSPEGGGLWIQEVNYGLTANGQTDVPGYSGLGVGLVGGYELPATPVGVLGLTAGATALEMKDRARPSSTARFTIDVAEAGAYWRVGSGGFSASAKLAGDYLHARDERDVAISGGGTIDFSGQAVGRWSGVGVNARVRVGYETWFGSFYARPQVGLDYVRLQEDGYTETGGGALDLTVDSRTSSRASGFVGTSIGRLYGQDGSWGPELLVGYRGAFSDSVGATSARFVAGGDPFTLSAAPGGASGGVARVGVKGENGYGGFSVEGGAEVRSNVTVFDLTLTAHMRF